MSSQDRVEIGVIGKPHGVRGAMRLFLHNAESPIFDTLATTRVVAPDGDKVSDWSIRTLRPGSKGSFVLIVDEVTTRELAEAHRGWKLMFPTEDLPDLEEDEFYYHELPGFIVETTTGRRIGEVVRVTDTQLDVLEVKGDDGREWLIPVVSDFVTKIDAERSRVVVVDNLEELFGDLD